MKKKTHDEYVAELAIKNPNIEVVGEYVDAKTKIEHHCLIHNIYWNIQPSNALQGQGCEMCRREKLNKSHQKTHEQYVVELYNVNKNIIVKEPYIDAKTPILHECIVHNIEWKIAPSNALQGQGCYKCKSEKIRNKLSKTHEQYFGKLKKANQNIKPIEQYVGANIPILHKCLIDGYEWYATPANVLFGYCCPQCNESSGERKARQWLDAHNIKYIYQKVFKDCKNIRPLPFDFYLPEYNICIEYDGMQHFKPVEYFGGEDSFRRRVEHDNIKTDYCLNNNIQLLRISYLDNVEEKLNSFLFI